MRGSNENLELTLSVLIPTYKRPRDLERCLISLVNQEELAKQIVVIRRQEDSETQEVLNKFKELLPIDVCVVVLPGVVHAMNAGLAKITSDITILTDDDSEVPAQWLQQIKNGFAKNLDAVGIGGRDIVTFPDGSEMVGASEVVGKITWYGRIIGNHHIGIGGARKVHILKGVNSAYKTEKLKMIGFDSNLKGSGAQTHWEVVLGRRISNVHSHLIYDPEIAVRHHVSKRHDEDQRLAYNPTAFSNSVHNEFYSISVAQHPIAILICLFWHTVIGHKSSPGLIYTIAKLIKTRQFQQLTMLRLANSARMMAISTTIRTGLKVF